MQLGSRKQQIWNGSFTFQKRETGLGGWFVVVGNLRLTLPKCWECGKPILQEPTTHYTEGNIDIAHSLRSWLNESGVDTGRQYYCEDCGQTVVYDSGGSGPRATGWDSDGSALQAGPT